VNLMLRFALVGSIKGLQQGALSELHLEGLVCFLTKWWAPQPRQ
jgi:hypothetical protein